MEKDEESENNLKYDGLKYFFKTPYFTYFISNHVPRIIQYIQFL